MADRMTCVDIPTSAQCQHHGCAGKLLRVLRARGCAVWGEIGEARPFTMLPTALMVTAVAPGAEMAALGAEPLLRVHWQRMLMLLWAEYGGAN